MLPVATHLFEDKRGIIKNKIDPRGNALVREALVELNKAPGEIVMVWGDRDPVNYKALRKADVGILFDPNMKSVVIDDTIVMGPPKYTPEMVNEIRKMPDPPLIMRETDDLEKELYVRVLGGLERELINRVIDKPQKNDVNPLEPRAKKPYVFGLGVPELIA
jgi:hypothetical protein